MRISKVAAVKTSLRAQLAGADGQPIKYLYVTVEFQDAAGAVVQKANAPSGADGKLVIGDPPVGSFNVVIKVEGYNPTEPSWQSFVEDQATDLATVTLTKVGSAESKAVAGR